MAWAAALLHSIAGMHPLRDGNNRVSWAVVRLFYELNDVTLRAPEDQAYGLVLAVAAGTLCEVNDVARQLLSWKR